MSIEYHVIAKRPPHLLDQATLYYPILKRRSTQSTEQISEIISKRCSLHPADVHAVVIALSHEIRHSLESGMAVHLDQLGTFSLAARTKGSPDPRQVRESHIEKVAMRFHADKRIKTWMARLSFRKARS